MDCGNKTAIAGGLDPRLLGEVGDLAFTIAICASQQRFAIAYRSQIPLILLRRRLFGRYRTTPEDDTGANREPECLPSWNNRVGSALFLAASAVRQK
jgi:hypothetical protein